MPPAKAREVRVSVEAGRRRVFATALDWPGWCRSGRDEDAALETLSGYAGRFAPVAAAGGERLPDRFALAVVERLPGDATTDFGAPGAVGEDDQRPVAGRDLDRLLALVAACWPALDAAAAAAPAQLRKGPRGGGRDRDAIVEHVLNAELAYVRKLGARIARPDRADTAAITAERAEVLAALRRAAAPEEGPRWPVRYAARRIAWHVLDHAWEITDRAGPDPWD